MAIIYFLKKIKKNLGYNLFLFFQIFSKGTTLVFFYFFQKKPFGYNIFLKIRLFFFWLQKTIQKMAKKHWLQGYKNHFFEIFKKFVAIGYNIVASQEPWSWKN